MTNAPGGRALRMDSSVPVPVPALVPVPVPAPVPGPVPAPVPGPSRNPLPGPPRPASTPARLGPGGRKSWVH
ncbi:hypothetical protein GCM10010394_57530 [Streptomyces crystallinus]|uniref:Uncharacterized protein n=1 Tax=Streptomyces crystallinus TaxID=68191 RepID=A0ABN1GU41_9ACTN